MSWLGYDQYSHAETERWIHLQTFESSFQILCRNCAVSVLEKTDIVSLFKTGDEQLSKNYLPISSLPITDEIFERLQSNVWALY